MTEEEAKRYAENMTYREAICNLKQAKSVPYRKATFIKINELLDELEQDKPMVEIDLYSIIKQKYIEREVLDKISAEVKALSPEPTAYDVVDGNPVKDAVWEIIGDVRQIIDKYKVESEVKANENEK